MAYYTGTINSATPSVAYMDAIHPQMQSGGLTFVETYTSGTDVTNIYKSPGASNSLGIDYFIFINRQSTTGIVSWSVSELYDVSTHLASKYAPRGLVTTANSDYSVAGSVLPSATTTGASLSKTGGGGGMAINTAHTYYLNVTPERSIFGFNNPTGALSSIPGMMYVGVYEPMYDSIATLPTLCVLALVGTANSASSASSVSGYTQYHGAMTRDYGVATTVSASAIAPGFAFMASNYNYSQSGNAYVCYGTLSYPSGQSALAYGGNATETLRLTLSSGRSNGSLAIAGGAYIGLIKDVISNSRGSNLSSIGGDTLAVTNFAGTVLNYVKVGSQYTQQGLYWFPVQ